MERPNSCTATWWPSSFHDGDLIDCASLYITTAFLLPSFSPHLGANSAHDGGHCWLRDWCGNRPAQVFEIIDSAEKHDMNYKVLGVKLEVKGFLGEAEWGKHKPMLDFNERMFVLSIFAI